MEYYQWATSATFVLDDSSALIIWEGLMTLCLDGSKYQWIVSVSSDHAGPQQQQREHEARAVSAGTKIKHKHKLAGKYIYERWWEVEAPTQGGPVLTDQPAVVDEERRQADREHGGREEEEEDVELGLCVREAVLKVGRGAELEFRTGTGRRITRQQGRVFYWSCPEVLPSLSCTFKFYYWLVQPGSSGILPEVYQGPSTLMF